ncbi:hypothetical protein NBRC10512v2_005378 [Rhodotorula toruloides]|uniref:RHTO0S24e01442g1_1 n=1 Tax=Rhodotorula toruloides TaxID=5286 RepID=A0A061BQ86_RHOTO|nr:RHTO0S24e01442g1_1 [Rhodotorula toruloides]
MTIVLGLSPTNMAFADKLDQLLLRGTLSDIQEELHRPTSSVADCARLSKRCTTSALSILDSSTSYGTLVVGCAALARRSFAFRLACFSMILERGANPFARGTDGRAVSWILDGIKNSAERQCFEEELQAAQKAWKSSEKYEMALDIREWIEDSLAVMEEEKREAFKQSKREAFVQSPQEIEPAVAERAPTPTPPPGKRPRLESPAPEKLPSSQNESLPDYDEVVTGSKTELVEPKLPPPEPTPVTGEPAPPKHQDETPAPPGQASQAPSTVPVSAVPPTGAPSTSSRLSRLPPGVVQGPQVQPKPSSQPSTSRLPPPPPPPLAPDTLTPVAASTLSAAPPSAAPASVTPTPAPQPAQPTPPTPAPTASPAPDVAPAPIRKSRLPASLLGRPPPALRVKTTAPLASTVSPASQPDAATPSGATADESTPPKTSPSVARLPPTAQSASPAKALSTSRLPPGLSPSSKVSPSTSLPPPSASPA